MTDPERQVLHIGLAKTGTTSLQRHVFPHISKSAGYAYNPPELMETLSRFLLFQRVKDRQEIEAIRAQHDRIFISDESLATWLPQHFEAAANRLLSLWGSQTTILLSLRDPVAFQESLYAGSFRAGAYVSPQQFFLSHEQYSQTRFSADHWLDDAFNVDAFDYRRLVDIYRKRFERVIVMPHETQFDLRAVARVFNIDDDQRSALASKLAAAPRLNSRPASWDIKALTLYVKMTGKQMTSPGLASKLKQHADQPDTAQRGSKRRRLWLRLRAILYRLLPQTPYRLPDNVYRNAELTQRNREFLAELVAENRALALQSSRRHDP
ncbi:MAG: hypothetical protein AAFQ27_04990 [Pseudomonadota bacterium]